MRLVAALCLASSMLCLSVLTAGCGQKGPLYLPDEGSEESVDESNSE